MGVFICNIQVLLLPKVHYTIVIALVAYYKYQSETSFSKIKKLQNKSNKDNDLNKATLPKFIWKQEIYEKYSTESDKIEEDSDVEFSPYNSSTQQQDESTLNKQDKPDIVIDIADIKSRQKHSNLFTNVLSQPAPKNILGKGANEEYFWTHHGNELEGCKGNAYANVHKLHSYLI